MTCDTGVPQESRQHADGKGIPAPSSLSTTAPDGDRLLRILEGRPGTSRALSALWVVALLWASFLLVWAAGGTDHLPPHWFYIPVLLAGGRFGLKGALVCGLVAGILAGPLTPASVADGRMQPLSDWGTRTLFFVAVGLFLTTVVQRTKASADQELEDLRVSTDLAGAADRGELVLEFQPIVSLDDREVIAAEALVRWNHPVRGRVMPDQFIPQGEASGEIHALGAWVIDEACRRFATWRRDTLDGDRSFRLSVNVSIHQLEDGDLAAVVQRALRRHRLPADRLVLEITETAALTQRTGALRALERLRALGVLVAVDDFGTGYSSLAYLRQLPIDIVKIDRAFVQRLGAEGHDDDRRIAAGIIDLAHDLGLTVVAEGIEDEGQARMLLDLGCRRGQGYLFAPPLTADDLASRLTHAEPGTGDETTRRPASASASSDRTVHHWMRRALRTPDTTGQHQARVTALAALFIAGAGIALTTSALTPERTFDSLLVALVGASGIPMAILLLRLGHRIPRWALHGLLACGALTVSVGAVLAGEPSLTVATTSLYIWVVLYAAAFYDWPVTAAHFGVVAAFLTAVLTITDNPQPVGILVLILGSAAVGAGVVGWLARQLRAVASTDLLTGLPNRQAFEALLPQEMARAERDGTPLCLAVVDVDDFKEINDTHGHQAGDEILAGLPRQWQGALREGDALARVGGDEFVVLLPDCLLADAVVVLERMGANGQPTCSVGVAALGEGESADRLMARADRALYEAKAAGVGRVMADRRTVDPEPVATDR